MLVDRQAANIPFAGWLLEDQSPNNMQFVLEQTDHTPERRGIGAEHEQLVPRLLRGPEAPRRRVPLIYVVCEELNDLVASCANTNTPKATVVALGKHMMFWERPAEFNQILDTFSKRWHTLLRAGVVGYRRSRRRRSQNA